jgi:hypothetical protein
MEEFFISTTFDYLVNLMIRYGILQLESAEERGCSTTFAGVSPSNNIALSRLLLDPASIASSNER